MGGSNRVEPLMKQENELKKMTFSVLVGAEMYKKERLRNIAKKSSKKRKW